MRATVLGQRALLSANPKGEKQLLELDLRTNELDVQVLGSVNRHARNFLDHLRVLLESSLVDCSLAHSGEATQKTVPTQVLHRRLFVIDDKRALRGP